MSLLECLVVGLLGLVFGSILLRRSGVGKTAQVEHEVEVKHERAVEQITKQEQTRLEAIDRAQADAHASSPSQAIRDLIKDGKL